MVHGSVKANKCLRWSAVKIEPLRLVRFTPHHPIIDQIYIAANLIG